eukprot:8475762-Pyramimonas_sp.AAC.1
MATIPEELLRCDIASGQTAYAPSAASASVFVAVDAVLQGVWFRLVSVHFPRGKSSDTQAQEARAAISELKREVQRKKLDVIIGGDFHAEAGKPAKGDGTAVGEHGLD